MRKLLSRLSDELFHPPRPGAGSRAFQKFFLAALFVVGAAHWVGFLNGGDLLMTAHDWPAQRTILSVWRQALADGAIPYHISTARVAGTARFFSVPDLAFFPLLPLLPKMGDGMFMLASVLLFYAIGFLGCLMIHRRFQLSAVAFATLFLLFNFNGHITSHLGVGHPWFGYFFLPFFVLFVLKLSEGASGLVVPIQITLTLWAMQIEGCFHIMLYGLALVGLMAVFHWKKYWRAAFWVFLLTGLLGAFRFLPPAVEFYNKGYRFVSGYRSLYDLFEALVSIKEYGSFPTGGMFGRQGWWEYDLYVGALGLAALIYLGIVVRRQKSWSLAGRRYETLDLPLFILALLSLSYFHAFVGKLPIPLFNSERASSRFLIVPFVMLLVIACSRMQEGLDRLEKVGRWRWLIIPALMETAFELVNHSIRWSPMLLERAENVPLYGPAVRIVLEKDALYQGVVNVSALVTLAALIFSIAFLLRRKFRATPAATC